MNKDTEELFNKIKEDKRVKGIIVSSNKKYSCIFSLRDYVRQKYKISKIQESFIIWSDLIDLMRNAIHR